MSFKPKSDNNLLHLVGTMEGPADTVYQDIVFKMEITDGESYPFNPPHIKFVTSVFHPNISEAGEICLDILSKQWTRMYTLESTIRSIQELLRTPNVDDPFNDDAAVLWSKDKEQFIKRAKSYKK